MTAPGPRYIVATTSDGFTFAATIYRRGVDARLDEAVDVKGGFRTRVAARQWGRDRIRQMGSPS